MKKVNTIDLRSFVGEIVARDIYVNGMLYLRSGARLLPQYADKLIENEHQIPFLFLDTEDSQGIGAHELISEEVHSYAEKALDELMKNYSDINGFAKMKMAVGGIIGNVIANKSATANVDMMISYGKGLLGHSLNVALLATVLSLKANLSLEKIEKIALGALLHDIGKVPIFKAYPHLSDNSIPCTPAEFEVLKEHPLRGYKIVENQLIPPLAKKIILMHHVWEQPERSWHDGTRSFKSYPELFLGCPIRPSNKDLGVSIVQCCDVFEAMINRKTRERPPLSKLKALEYIRDMEAIQFGKAASLMWNTIAPFGIGDAVILNNGIEGIVSDLTGIPDRPKIRLRSGTILDLRTDLKLFVAEEK